MNTPSPSKRSQAYAVPLQNEAHLSNDALIHCAKLSMRASLASTTPVPPSPVIGGGPCTTSYGARTVRSPTIKDYSGISLFIKRMVHTVSVWTKTYTTNQHLVFQKDNKIVPQRLKILLFDTQKWHRVKAIELPFGIFTLFFFFLRLGVQTGVWDIQIKTRRCYHQLCLKPPNYDCFHNIKQNYYILKAILVTTSVHLSFCLISLKT